MPTNQRVRLRREELGLTQEELADRVNANLEHAKLPAWHWTTVSKVERGMRAVKADELPALAQALECSPLDLLDPIKD